MGRKRAIFLKKTVLFCELLYQFWHELTNFFINVQLKITSNNIVALVWRVFKSLNIRFYTTSWNIKLPIFIFIQFYPFNQNRTEWKRKRLNFLGSIQYAKETKSPLNEATSSPGGDLLVVLLLIYIDILLHNDRNQNSMILNYAEARGISMAYRCSLL